MQRGLLPPVGVLFEFFEFFFIVHIVWLFLFSGGRLSGERLRFETLPLYDKLVKQGYARIGLPKSRHRLIGGDAPYQNRGIQL